MSSVTIGNEIEDIAFNAFEHCYELTSISIPYQVFGYLSGEPWGAINAVMNWT